MEKKIKEKAWAIRNNCNGDYKLATYWMRTPWDTLVSVDSPRIYTTKLAALEDLTRNNNPQGLLSVIEIELSYSLPATQRTRKTTKCKRR